MNKFFLSVSTVMLLSGCCCHHHHGDHGSYVVEEPVIIEEPVIVEKPKDSDRVYVKDPETGHVYIKERQQLIAPE